MAHFNVCILVKKTGNETDEQMLEQATDAVMKFNSDLEVPQYKWYIDAEEIERMSGYYNTDKLDELAEKLEDWNGNKGFVDEGGLYALSTNNPDGHFDYGDILGQVSKEDWHRIFLEGNDEKVCNAVVTPDGSWISGPWVYSDSNPESKKKLDDWVEKISDIFRKNEDAVAFLADCHM